MCTSNSDSLIESTHVCFPIAYVNKHLTVWHSMFGQNPNGKLNEQKSIQNIFLWSSCLNEQNLHSCKFYHVYLFLFILCVCTSQWTHGSKEHFASVCSLLSWVSCRVIIRLVSWFIYQLVKQDNFHRNFFTLYNDIKRSFPVDTTLDV